MSESKNLVTIISEDKKKKWPTFLEETTDESEESSSSDETESSISSDDESSKADSKTESNDGSKRESKDDTDSSSLSDSDSEEEDEIVIAKRTLAKSYFRNGKVVCPNFPFSPNRIFVWFLTHQVSRDHVFEMFVAFGKIVGLFMPRFNELLPDEFRFAVIQYSSLDECNLAVKFMDNATVDNINIRVSITKPPFILGIDFSASSKMQTRPERHRRRVRSPVHRYGYGFSSKSGVQRLRDSRFRRSYRRTKRGRIIRTSRRPGYRSRRN